MAPEQLAGARGHRAQRHLRARPGALRALHRPARLRGEERRRAAAQARRRDPAAVAARARARSGDRARDPALPRARPGRAAGVGAGGGGGAARRRSAGGGAGGGRDAVAGDGGRAKARQSGERLRAGRPPGLLFWYRSSPRQMVPTGAATTSCRRRIRRSQSPTCGRRSRQPGRLVEFSRVPPQLEDSPERPRRRRRTGRPLSSWPD